MKALKILLPLLHRTETGIIDTGSLTLYSEL